MGASQSILIKDKSKAKLIFPNFYFHSAKKPDYTFEKENNLSQKQIKTKLNKCKKYISSYANLAHIKPKGVTLKINSIKYNEKDEELVCNVVFDVKKNTKITQDEYKKYIEDTSNGPFEGSWNDSPGNLVKPEIIFN